MLASKHRQMSHSFQNILYPLISKTAGKLMQTHFTTAGGEAFWLMLTKQLPQIILAFNVTVS